MQSEATTRLLTVAEAADKLNCRKETIRRYIATGHLPAVKLPGGYYRIRKEALEQLLKPIESIEAKYGQVNVPLQAVVGSTLTLTIPVTAICPHCVPLLEAARESLPLLVGYHQFLDDYPLPVDSQLPSTIAKLNAALAAVEKEHEA